MQCHKICHNILCCYTHSSVMAISLSAFGWSKARKKFVLKYYLARFRCVLELIWHYHSLNISLVAFQVYEEWSNVMKTVQYCYYYHKFLHDCVSVTLMNLVERWEIWHEMLKIRIKTYVVPFYEFIPFN